MDVAIVDTLWNGVGESVKIAALCDTFEVNCAAHNYHGWLGALARWKTNDNQRIISIGAIITSILTIRSTGIITRATIALTVGTAITATNARARSS